MQILPICLSIYLSVCLSLCLSVRLSVCLSIYPSIYIGNSWGDAILKIQYPIVSINYL